MVRLEDLLSVETVLMAENKKRKLNDLSKLVMRPNLIRYINTCNLMMTMG